MTMIRWRRKGGPTAQTLGWDQEVLALRSRRTEGDGKHMQTSSKLTLVSGESLMSLILTTTK